MKDLSGKVALITGASRGIGAATARRLANAGAAVVITARGSRDLDDVARTLTTTGARVLAMVADVADYAQVDAVVGRAVEVLGRIDILVNNAGTIEPIARLADTDPAAWSRVVDINYKGVYNGIRACLPPMLTGGGGTIVNISSGAATSPLEGWSHYCSTKAAVLMLTRCTDKEYRDRGIRSVGLSPGTVATTMQTAIKASGINPVSQLDPSVHISPQWVAEAVAWLCTAAGDAYLGSDFSLKSDEAKVLVGLRQPARG